MNTINKLISIVVPVYNSELFINRLIDSLLIQTYSNFEIIIIDDGSKDKSEKLIKKYTDSRIRYYKQKNHGVSFARNRGITLSKGEYICFIDSDDYVKKKYLESMINSIIGNGSDLSICGYKIIEDGIYKKTININCADAYETILIKSLKKETVYFALWNKLFKKSVIVNNRIVFNESISSGSGEDMEFVIHYLASIKNVALVNHALYFYCRHYGSASFCRKNRNEFNNNWLTEEIAIEEIKKNIDNKYIKYLPILYSDYCSHILELMVHYNIYDARYKHCLRLLQKNVVKSVVHGDGCIKSKIKLLVVACKPNAVFTK